jgi:ATP-dependent DNA helicase PIF1
MFKQSQIVTSGLNESLKEMMAEYILENGISDIDLDENGVPDDLNSESTLSKSQKKAFDLFKKGKSLSIFSSAGCGKSTLIKIMQEYHEKKKDGRNMYLTSTTGISSFNLGGCTIHSFMGIGTGESDMEYLLRKILKNKVLYQRLFMTDILVIDEISMLSASIFEKINLIFQCVKKNKKAFGGIQLILTGDLMQILPIFNNTFNKENFDERLIIESEIFIKMFKDKIIILNENFRQKNDSVFIELLLRVRKGEHTGQDIDLLKSRLDYDEDDPIVKNSIHLVSYNKKAQYINESNLKKLPGPEISYDIEYKKKYNTSEEYKLLQKELESQFRQKGMIKVQLRKGARVILIKNLDVAGGLVNGSIGTILEFKGGYPEVLFDSGVKQIITKVDWELELDGNKVSAVQVPLMLAYAITINRSQSLSLDSAVMDLSDVFADHMKYVALSRVRNLNGLFLKSFNENKITINKKMREFIDKYE